VAGVPAVLPIAVLPIAVLPIASLREASGLSDASFRVPVVGAATTLWGVLAMPRAHKK
jgi:hypothetical protein